jgi:hypothetical protein
MIVDLIILGLGMIAIGVLVIAIKVIQLSPSIRDIGAYARRLERENTEREERENAPMREQRIIHNMVRSTPSGSEGGMKIFIKEYLGMDAANTYFQNHPEEAARFNWFDGSSEGKQKRDNYSNKNT